MSSRKVRYILAAAILIIAAGAGYYFWDQNRVKLVKNKKPDVLLAQECGFDGLKCCATEPSCSYGQQCCVDPNNSSNNQCADSCGTGKQDQFCGPGNQCDPGLICSNGKCTACGGENQPCCGKTECDSTTKAGRELACKDEKCVICGLNGNPCCKNSNACLNIVSPIQSFGECTNGLCQPCGGDEQPACATGEKCLKDYLLNGNNCYQCGGANQPCCSNNSCNDKSLKCVYGFCEEVKK